MFTTQVTSQLAPLAGREPTREWTNELIDRLIGLMGQCNQNIEHRGPVRIENTHRPVLNTGPGGAPDPNGFEPPTTEDDGEPGLTVCTRSSNNTLPGTPIAIHIECGLLQIDDGTVIGGGSTVNGCMTVNGNLLVNGLIASQLNGYGGDVVRICLTGAFDTGGGVNDGTAPAVIIEATDDAPNVKPIYAPTGPAIRVIDRTGMWSACADTDWCGYAVFYANAELPSNCDAVSTEPGEGYYEVIQLHPQPAYTTCSRDYVTKTCCVAGRIVVCTRSHTTSVPFDSGEIDCGGSLGEDLCT